MIVNSSYNFPLVSRYLVHVRLNYKITIASKVSCQNAKLNNGKVEIDFSFDHELKYKFAIGRTSE